MSAYFFPSYKEEGDIMKQKLLAMMCIAFLSGLSVHASEAVPERMLGEYNPQEAGAHRTPTQGEIDQWIANWSHVFGEEAIRAASKGERDTIPLTDGYKQIKVNTMGGGAFEGTFIYEPTCKGGDIRGLFTAPGEFAMVLFNWVRYDNHCGVLFKGDLDLPPPLSYNYIIEAGLTTGTGALEVSTPGVWFHESVNDSQVQDWIEVSTNWQVNVSWNPSITYDMAGDGVTLWNLTYFGARTYPRPAHDGFQYEACFRKNSGGPTTAMALYFNGDGTMDNCIWVSITSVDGYYSAYEKIGGTIYELIPWTMHEPNLFVDDDGVAGENVFNMVKVNVYDNGLFNIYINGQYVAAAQSFDNLSGYVGLVIADNGSEDHVSCDNMTLSTETYPKESIADRKIRRGVRIADPMRAVSPE